MGSTARPSLGLSAGAATVFRSIGFLMRRPDLWPAALVPGVVLLALSAAAVAASIRWVRPMVHHAWGETASVWARAGAEASAWAAVVAAAVLGTAVALLLTPPLSAPALETIVGARERELGAPERRALGFWAEILCGLKAQLLALGFAVPAVLLLWLVDLVWPPALVVTVPVRIVVSALAIAWNLLDYPLTLRGWSMRERLALLRRHSAACLGFGLAFAALFSIPCFSVLMLPIGVAAAAEMTARMTRP